MNEENRHPGAELNEAELASVSGALEQDDYLNLLSMRICNACEGRRRNRICGGSRAVLREYMRTHGQISDFSACPYLKDVPKSPKPIDPNAVG